jgi:hypothetical protein
MVASLSMIAILSTLVVSTATAGTFSDVPADSGYYTAVEALAAAGVVDATKGTFKGTENLQRGEAAKLAVLAGEFGDLDNPAEPTFKDVPKLAWAYKYVETAFAHNVLSGYGDKPGYFGPNDGLTRAQYAKMLVNALQLPMDSIPTTPTFSDVPTTYWGFPFIETAYHWQVVNGMGAGKFNPTGSVTRYQAAIMTNAAMNPVVRPGSVPPVDNGGNGGDLTVEISTDTPSSDNVPQLAVNVPFTTVDFAAASDDVEVSQLTVSRTGLGDEADLAKVAILDASNNEVLVKGRSLTTEGGKDYVTFTFSPALVVAKGSTKSLTLAATIDTVGSSGGIHKLGIAKEADIVTNASSVDGTFPMYGDSMAISNVEIGQIALDGVANDNDYNIGEEAVTVSEFDITAPTSGNGDAELQNLRLKNKGTAKEDAVTMFTLEIDGEEVATADAMVGDYVTFAFDTAYLLEEGNVYNATVKANIAGGQGDTLQLVADQETDVFATSTKYDGYGVAVDITGFTTAAASEIGIIGADITVSFEGPAAADMAADIKNYTFANFKLLAKEDVDFSTLIVKMTETDGADAGTGVVDVTNLELFDTTNNVLYSAGDPSGADGAADAPNTYTFEDIFFKGGTQYNFVIRGDVPSTAGAADKYLAAIDFTAASAEWSTSGDAVTMADSLSSTTLTGKTMTVAYPKLTADVSTLQAFSTVGGSTGILMYKSTLEANNVKDIKVSRIAVDVAGASTVTLAQLSQIKLVKIEKDGTETVLDSVNNPSGSAVSFSGFSLVVPKGSNNKVTFGVRGDVKDNPTAGDLVLEVPADANYTAKDVDNKTVTGANLVPDTTVGPVVTIAAHGSLTIITDFSEVGTNADQQVLGGQKVLVARYKMDAANEDAKIVDLTLNTTGSATADDVKAVYLYKEKAMTTPLADSTIDASGNVVFEGVNIVIPEAGVTYLYVAVEFKNVGDEGSQTAISGHTFVLDSMVIGDLDTVGASTEDDITETVAGAAASKTTYVYASGITELKNAYPTTSSLVLTGTSTIFDFTVKAPSHNNVIDGETVKTYLNTVTLTFNGGVIDENATVASGKVGITELTIRRHDQSTDGEVTIDLTGLDTDGSIDLDLATLFPNDSAITAGTTAEFVVDATVTDIDQYESLRTDISDVAGGDLVWGTMNAGSTPVSVSSVLIQGLTRLQGHTLSNN